RSFSLFQSNCVRRIKKFHIARLLSNENDARRTLFARQRSLANEIDHGPAMHHAGQIERVPIGKSNAAMRFGLADLLRRRRAMNAIARRAQIDPDDADRILRSRSDRKFVLGLHAFETEPRVVAIGRVVGDALDLELSAWRRLFGAAD